MLFVLLISTYVPNLQPPWFPTNTKIWHRTVQRASDTRTRQPHCPHRLAASCIHKHFSCGAVGVIPVMTLHELSVPWRGVHKQKARPPSTASYQTQNYHCNGSFSVLNCILPMRILTVSAIHFAIVVLVLCDTVSVTSSGKIFNLTTHDCSCDYCSLAFYISLFYFCLSLFCFYFSYANSLEKAFFIH